MRRWVPRPVDLVAAAVLAAVTQVELWVLAPPGFPVAPVAASYAVGCAAVAWHRVAPMAALVVGITGLAVVPGALGVDPAVLFGWFVTVLALMASVGYHARRPVLALGVSLVLWAASIVVQKGLVVEDVLFAWLLAGGAWLAGRAIAGRTLRAELSEQRAAAAEQQAQWRAAAAVAEERLRIARPLGRELQLARGTVHQLHAEPLLEPRHQLAHGRRRHVEQPRRGREAAGLDHLDEGFHLARTVHIEARHGDLLAWFCVN
jgi:signal transduction histidine kinase